MECRIEFEIKDEEEFNQMSEASHLPGEVWKLIDDDGNFIKAFRGTASVQGEKDGK